jgi:hypothetical protein
MKLLVWSDASAFRMHLEVMRTFRQSHVNFLPGEWSLKDGMSPCDGRPSLPEKLIIHLAGPGVNAVLVPVWQIEVPPGGQN